ncbi:gustatory receptor 5a for trehalose-like [Diabrotica virgifera virgifera]|uniref:Gustatory receptor n=1 Tax=Diabrotica virgifera virgifera TaxID=50390 RepID=A0ABM5L7D5_DIAVI|nr:gustatory receptor 5a for trehalose-like [Diabrotica virgifera virgifera]
MYLYATSKPQADNLLLHSKIENNTLHSAMKLPLQIGQVFGLFPLYVGGATYESLKIKWCYWRMVYSILMLIGIFFITIITTYKNVPEHHDLLSLEGVIFFINATIQALLFFKLTFEWPDYVKEWNKVETRLSNMEAPGSLKQKLNSIAIAVLILATVEHYLVTAAVLKSSFAASASISEGIRYYFQSSYSAAFSLVKYNFWLGCLLEFINVQTTFLWNYIDVFIMLIGEALKFRLQQLNQRIRIYSKTEICNLQVWRTCRTNYLRIVALCQITNERISTLILLSFLVNLYFVLKQIFKSLTKFNDSIKKAYFYISFCLMVIRISCVIIFGSGIHDEWQETSQILQTVSSSAYNVELERFIKTVTTYELALSGKNFFSVRRQLILQIAGTIVTYELVIIQFYNEMLKNEM